MSEPILKEILREELQKLFLMYKRIGSEYQGHYRNSADRKDKGQSEAYRASARDILNLASKFDIEIIESED